MNLLKRAWLWLTTKHQKETPVTDTSTTETTTNPETVTYVIGQSAKSDAVLAKVKELLITIGHDVEGEFDEIVALAKKLVAKSS